MFCCKNPCAIRLMLTLAGRCFALILAICACKSRGGSCRQRWCVADGEPWFQRRRWVLQEYACNQNIILFRHLRPFCSRSWGCFVPEVVTILFRHLWPFCSGICGKTEGGLATRGCEGTSSPLFLSRFFTTKFVTNYIEIYTLVFHDAKIYCKYTILSVFLQCVENQCFMFIIPYSALRILHSVLPLGIFRVAKHA